MTLDELLDTIKDLPRQTNRKVVRNTVQACVDGLRDLEFELCSKLLQKEREAADDD